MARVIKERDQHCAWPGCTHSRHLHIHHIKHWADGGETSVHNGVCLCSFHHTMVHEGGYRIEQVEGNTQRLHEQFVQQQHNEDINQFDFEKSLRNDNDSFNTVRKLSPTRFRYRIFDANSQQVLSGHFSGNSYSEPIDSAYEDNTDSTHVYKDTTCVNKNDAMREDSAEYTCVYRNDAKHENLDDSTRVYKNVAAQTDQYSTMQWWCNSSALTNEASANYAMHA